MDENPTTSPYKDIKRRRQYDRICIYHPPESVTKASCNGSENNIKKRGCAR